MSCEFGFLGEFKGAEARSNVVKGDANMSVGSRRTVTKSGGGYWSEEEDCGAERESTHIGDEKDFLFIFFIYPTYTSNSSRPPHTSVRPSILHSLFKKSFASICVSS